MDPFSQAIVGATFAVGGVALTPSRTNSHKHSHNERDSAFKRAAIIGALSGMAPDLDVLIRSSTDPLLALEFHRHFTHSLLFIPIGALLCTLVFYLLTPARWKPGFPSIYIWCFLGYGSHGMLDACTSYGTQLLWPLSDVRVAWNIISVIDPLFTLVLASLLLATVRKASPTLLCATLVWGALYLSAGWLQKERALTQARALAEHRGHYSTQIIAKPTFGNIAVWKLIYEYDGMYYIDAARPGLLVSNVWKGDNIKKLDLETQFRWLAADTQQARDVERFRHFSAGYLALDKRSPEKIIDIRYSLLPQNITGLWGLELNEHAKRNEHAVYFVDREPREGTFTGLLEMVVNGKVGTEG